MVHVSTRDRWSELSLLLQSLRTQTFKNWDITIVDASQTPIMSCDFLMKLITRIQMEGHKVMIGRATLTGNCEQRNQIIDIDDTDDELILRVDDDVILEPDYIKRLADAMSSGYDMASGVTPAIGIPEHRRSTEFVKPIINRFDFENGITGDDCGYAYIESEIIPADSLRSCFMYKRKILDAGVRFESGLSPVAFREEQFFTMRAAWKGFNKFAVDTGAVAWHLITPSGGCRYNNYNELVMNDNMHFWTWCRRMLMQKGNPFRGLQSEN